MANLNRSPPSVPGLDLHQVGLNIFRFYFIPVGDFAHETPKPISQSSKKLLPGSLPVQTMNVSNMMLFQEAIPTVPVQADGLKMGLELRPGEPLGLQAPDLSPSAPLVSYPVGHSTCSHPQLSFRQPLVLAEPILLHFLLHSPPGSLEQVISDPKRTAQ